MAEHKPNPPGVGVLFTNSDKSPHPQAPGHRGRMTCPCCSEELSLSAWVNTTKFTGIKFLKIKIDKYKTRNPESPEAEEPEKAF